ncbi:MAG: PmoA family protein, partial [Bacteroidales bacterium]|nr:PmoA family protein [Bacteroidales bacterium]
GEGSFVTTESWVDTSDIELLREVTEFHFTAKENIRIIDRKTILSAAEKEVNMPDTKEGMFGIRVARQLELPSAGTIVLYNEDGTTSRVKDTLNIGITGNYLSSEGISGEEVWGTRARWMHLSGNIEDENISLVICDHPENPNYPTYWHARTYGLFAANPLGVKDFTNGKDSLNFSISQGQSVTFRYRVIIASGEHLQAEDIDELSDEFALKYK